MNLMKNKNKSRWLNSCWWLFVGLLSSSTPRLLPLWMCELNGAFFRHHEPHKINSLRGSFSLGLVLRKKRGNNVRLNYLLPSFCLLLFFANSFLLASHHLVVLLLFPLCCKETNHWVTSLVGVASSCWTFFLPCILPVCTHPRRTDRPTGVKFTAPLLLLLNDLPFHTLILCPLPEGILGTI